MKLLKIMFLFIVSLFLFAFDTYGNSGPVIIEGFPGSEIIVDQNNEIRVNQENLIFNLAEDLYSNENMVSAQYEMENMSDETQTVHMIFPLVSSIYAMEKNVEVYQNDQFISAGKVYLDKVYHSSDLPSFEALIGRASKTEMLITNAIKCYEFIPSEDYQSIQIEISFNKTTTEGLVLIQNSNSYGYNSGKFVIGGWLGNQYYDRDSLKLFVTQGELKNLEYRILELNEERFTEPEWHSLKGGDNNLILRVSELSKTEIEEYMMSILFKESVQDYTNEEKVQMINQAMYELKTENSMSLLPLDGLSSFFNDNRIILLSYVAHFKPNEISTIEVKYPIEGTMDRRESTEPTFTFKYFLNPASYWKEFHNLNISIRLKPPYEHLIETSIPLERNETSDGILYETSLEAIPEQDLAFTVYTSETITTLDKVNGIWLRKYNYAFFLIVLPILIVVGIPLLMIFVIRKIK